VEEVRCPACDRDVPELPYCVSCGHRFACPHTGTAERFAADPRERLWAPRVASTLFPQLPRADLWPFRIALVLGVAVVVLLAVAGLYPVALGAAAALVPAEMAVYLYLVDVYEDTPGRAVALSLGWGVIAGGVFGFATARLVEPVDALYGIRATDLVVQALLVPVLGVAIAMLGPLWLRRDRRFDDTLDGVTFGSLAGGTFLGASVLGHANDLLRGGLRPPGSSTDWVLRLLELGLLLPITWAAAVGSVVAAVWLPPVAGRRSTYAHPMIVTVAALLLVCVAALAQLTLGREMTLVVLAVLAGIAVVVLRLIIHRGLRDEAGERTTGPSVRCANCGHETPSNTFCGVCGIALDALPKRAATTSVSEAGDLGRRVGHASVLAMVSAIVAIAAAVAVVLADQQQVSSPPPPCAAPPVPCSPPTGLPPALRQIATPRLVAANSPARRYQSPKFGFSFLYPAALESAAVAAFGVRLQYGSGNAFVEVIGDADTPPQAAVHNLLANLKLLGAQPMDAARAPAGAPIVGLLHATGGVWEATASDATGVTRPVRVAIASVRAHGLTIVTVAQVDSTDPDAGIVFELADEVSSSIRWPGQLGA
jgi:hypothetical protein